MEDNDIKLVPVPRSSNISHIGYDEQSKTLIIRFKNKGMYKYSPITLQSYLSFLRSKSKGKHFYKNIKNNKLIKYEKI